MNIEDTPIDSSTYTTVLTKYGNTLPIYGPPLTTMHGYPMTIFGYSLNLNRVPRVYTSENGCFRVPAFRLLREQVPSIRNNLQAVLADIRTWASYRNSYASSSTLSGVMVPDS